MYKIIVYNKMNNIIRFVFTEDEKEAIRKARNIAKAIGRKGGWTKIETEDFKQVTYFDYSPF